jgi:hypothetical protein
MKTWTYKPTPAKLNTQEKDNLKQKVNTFIQESERLKSVVNRIDIKGGRIYLYHLVEQLRWDDPDVQFIKPLIQGKYAEFPMARITLYDIRGEKCTADWQRHTGQWYSINEGNFADCLNFIEEEDNYFW